MTRGKALALTLGDRYGIGPEQIVRLVPHLLADDTIRSVIVGDRRVFDDACVRLGAVVDVPMVSSLDDASVRAPVSFLDRPFDAEVGPLGRVCAQAGLEVLETLKFLAGEIGRGRVEGLLYAPLNKQAMRDAGHLSGDELDFIASRLPERRAASEINVLDGLWVSRVTSHVPLSRVAELITRENVEQAIRIVAAAMRRAGTPAPRIAVAGLNPHAGENGLFGPEEVSAITPAIQVLLAEGEHVEGPFSPDTVFPSARKENMNAVVTMYHDQGQIALKALGLGRSITLLAGLAVPIATPGHGTAFDIVGKGIAEMQGIRSTLALCRAMM